MAIKALSILIPTYNDLCVKLVDDLRQQAEDATIDYEILVGDDGSTDAAVVDENQKIDDWPYCHYLRQIQNIGRAAIRNFLAQEAHHDCLLFIDSDMSMVRQDYLSNYLAMDAAEVVDGGITIGGDPEALKGNLRYRYEKSSEQEHTTEIRQKHPYRDFHTANFLIRRDLMLAHPFDERFRYYGYEDVLLGKQLQQSKVIIEHIDNPLGFSTFEENTQFIIKTEEGLRTLHRFQSDLRGYSRLLTLVEGIHLPIILNLIRCWHKLFGKWERKNLCGSHPNLILFKLYKLGYYLTIK
jgi:glycosyltransferase involved in cell wall biosynthesis